MAAWHKQGWLGWAVANNASRVAAWGELGGVRNMTTCEALLRAWGCREPEWVFVRYC